MKKKMIQIFSLVAFLVLLSSCGSPKTTIRVRNNADGTQTDISVTQGEGGSTSVNVVPSVNASLDSVNFKIK